MSDEKLRELERRWRESGSLEDEAAYLRERVRIGELGQERLELAAFLGYRSVRGFTEAARALSSVQKLAFDLWRGWGREAFLRAWLALVRRALQELWVESGPGLHTAELTIRLEDYLLCPCEPCLDRFVGQSHDWVIMGYLAREFGELRTEPELLEKRPWTAYSFEEVERYVPADELRAAVADELVPWALGYGDPVRKRVEART